MSLSVHGVSSAIAAGTTSVAVAYPTVSAADALFCFTSCKPESSDPIIGTGGWDDFGGAAGGAGSAGADSGQVWQRFNYRNAIGTETGTIALTVSGGNAALGCMVSISSNVAGKMALCPFLANIAIDSTAGTGFSTSHSLSVGFVTAGDIVVIAATTNSDANSFSAHSLTVPGCTMSAATVQKSGGTANGNDMYMVVCTFVCTAGSSNGSAATFSMTASGSAGNQNAGVAHLCVAREVDSTPHNVLQGNKGSIVGELWNNTPSGSPLTWANNDGNNTDTLSRTSGTPTATTTPQSTPALGLAASDTPTLTATTTWSAGGNAPTEVLVFGDFLVPNLASSTNGARLVFAGTASLQTLIFHDGTNLKASCTATDGANSWTFSATIPAGNAWYSLQFVIRATSGTCKVRINGVDATTSFTQNSGSYFVPDLSNATKFANWTLRGSTNDSGKVASLGVAATNSFYDAFADWQLAYLDTYQAALIVSPTVNGTLSATLASSTLTSTATALLQGSVSSTLAAATLSAAATAIVKATTSVTLAAATLSSTAQAPVRATAISTLVAASLAATAVAPVNGSVSGTLAAATLSATGATGNSGALSVTLAAATLAATAAIPVQATLVAALIPATLSATGHVTLDAVNATLSATLSAATLASSASVVVTATANVSLQPSSLAAIASLPMTGGLSATLIAATLDALGHIESTSQPAYLRFIAGRPLVAMLFSGRKTTRLTFVHRSNGMSINVGDDYELDLEVRNNNSGELDSPTGLVFYVRYPDGTDAQVSSTALSTGRYRLSFLITQAGRHQIVAIASGSLRGREPYAFEAQGTVADVAVPP